MRVEFWNDSLRNILLSEKLIDSKPSESKTNKINRIKQEVKKIIEEFETRRTDEIKNLGGIEMDALLLEGKINFARIRNSLDEMEMNKLEEEMKEEIKKCQEKKRKKAK